MGVPALGAEWVLRRRRGEERYAAELLELEAQIEGELAMDKANPGWREDSSGDIHRNC
jgi:hypothetical protein